MTTVFKPGDLVRVTDAYVMGVNATSVLIETGSHRIWLDPSKLEPAPAPSPDTPEPVPDAEAAWRFIEDECLTVRCVEYRTPGENDADVGWEVVSYHMAAPKERVIGHGPTPLAAALDALHPSTEADHAK